MNLLYNYLMKKLFDLHKSGALNEEEFQMAKNILLSSET